MTYVIRDREAGNEITEWDTLAEAKKMLEQYEEQDKRDGDHTPNFYEIVEKMEIITTSFNKKGGFALRDFLIAQCKPNLSLQAFIDDINSKEIFNGIEQVRSDYEISSSYTKSGNPILFDLLPDYFDFELEGV